MNWYSRRKIWKYKSLKMLDLSNPNQDGIQENSSDTVWLVDILCWWREVVSVWVCVFVTVYLDVFIRMCVSIPSRIEGVGWTKKISCVVVNCLINEQTNIRERVVTLHSKCFCPWNKISGDLRVVDVHKFISSISCSKQTCSFIYLFTLVTNLNRLKDLLFLAVN